MSFNLMCSKNKILINYKYIKFEYGGKGTREHLRVPTRMRKGGGGVGEKPALKRRWSGGAEWETRPKLACCHDYPELTC